MNDSYWSQNLHMDKSEILHAIRQRAFQIDKNINLMEVCGGHTNTIMKYGIKQLLPSNVNLISGPGCPVCVTSQKDVDAVIELALQGKPVATYGDMLRVPGTKMSLDEARSRGAPVYMVYSTKEVLSLQSKHPGIFFFGIGFETTTPMSAFLLENNVPVYSTHKLIVPAMQALLSGQVAIDGFILPGHVSVISGIEQYRALKVPQAVCGFEAEHILRGVYALLNLILNGKNEVVNTYPEAVNEDGNKKAKEIMARNFDIKGSHWRGLGLIPSSGLEVKNESLNVKNLYSEYIKELPTKENGECRCADILKGLINPVDCPLFGKACSPEYPQGACMVSSEGACQNYYRYSKE